MAFGSLFGVGAASPTALSGSVGASLFEVRGASSASLQSCRIPRVERIVELREEIAEISEANHLYLQGGKRFPAQTYHWTNEGKSPTVGACH
jgi:hypothetical protein